MNIIETVRSILQDFPKIGELVDAVHIDFLDTEPTDYGLSPTGDSLVREDILGNQTRQHSFFLYSRFSAINDYERLVDSTTLLELSLWLKGQTGKTVETTIGDETYTGTLQSLTAGNGMLYAIPEEAETGGWQYQLQITAIYTVER